MSSCWGVAACANWMARSSIDALLALGPTLPADYCECISIELGESAFHEHLNAALAQRKPPAPDELAAVAAATPSLKFVGRKRTTIDGPYLQLVLALVAHARDTRRLAPYGERAMWLEFGVASAGSTNLTCDALSHAGLPRAQVHGFDTFTGLPIAWNGTKYRQGAFTQHGLLPSVRRCARLHKGLISETLPSFLATHAAERIPPTLIGVSIDVDLYQPALDALTRLHAASILTAGAVVHFHEMVRPFGPADHRLVLLRARNRTHETQPVVAGLAAGGRRVHLHPFLQRLGRAARGTHSAAVRPDFYWSEEQRALYNHLKSARGALWALVPVVSEKSVESTVFVVIVAANNSTAIPG